MSKSDSKFVERSGIVAPAVLGAQSRQPAIPACQPTSRQVPSPELEAFRGAQQQFYARRNASRMKIWVRAVRHESRHAALRADATVNSSPSERSAPDQETHDGGGDCPTQVRLPGNSDVVSVSAHEAVREPTTTVLKRDGKSRSGGQSWAAVSSSSTAPLRHHRTCAENILGVSP